MKVCSSCDEEKELKMFSKRKISKDGYRNQCRECLNNKRRTPKRRNVLNNRRRERWKTDSNYREKEITRNKNFCKNNKEWVREYNKQYWEENKDDLKPINVERSRKHYFNNKERYKRNHLIWCKK